TTTSDHVGQTQEWSTTNGADSHKRIDDTNGRTAVSETKIGVQSWKGIDTSNDSPINTIASLVAALDKENHGKSPSSSGLEGQRFSRKFVDIFFRETSYNKFFGMLGCLLEVVCILKFMDFVTRDTHLGKLAFRLKGGQDGSTGTKKVAWVGFEEDFIILLNSNPAPKPLMLFFTLPYPSGHEIHC
ncbi:hypothetical protein KCU90_g20045, partial [Aureobasidium melanogenum]